MTSYPTLLGAAGHGSAGELYNAGNYYGNIGLGRCPMKGSPFTTESYVSQTIRLPGTISYLSWRIDTAFGAALSLTLNKNSSGTDLAVSFGSATTGWITDSTDSVSVSSGDTLDFVTNVASSTTYSGEFYCASARFDADSGSAQLVACVGQGVIPPTSETLFFNFVGVLGDGDQTESDKQFKCLSAGTWQNMACHIESNSFDRTTLISNRKNGSNGSMAIYIPEGTSGHFEDSTHNDSVSVGDLLSYGIVAVENGNGDTLTIDWMGAHFLASTAWQCMIGGAPDSPPLLQYPQVYYTSLVGGGDIGGVLPRATGLFPYGLTASNYTNLITSSDMGSGAATFTLLKNGSASALAVSSAGSSGGKTGYIADNTDTVDFVVGDTCTNMIVPTNGVGTYIDWASSTLLIQASST